MKKLISKRIKKRKLQKPQGRITNETVAEHREHILAGGRRFKYPMQYSRHKLVYNTIIISVITLVVLVLVGWWQLYIMQNTSDFIYRVTRVLPVSVASIDGESVRYSDYLMRYQSSIHYMYNKEQPILSPEDDRRQRDYFKRQSIDEAVRDAYATKLAGDLGITVSDQEVADVIEEHRSSIEGGISERAYYEITLDYYNWSPSDLRYIMRKEYLRQKVAFEIDETASKLRDEVANKTEDDTDMDELAADIEPINGVEVESNVSGFVPSTNRDGGLAAAAAKLEVGEVSDAIQVHGGALGSGYYFVQLIDRSGDRVNYAYIRVPLTEFDRRLEEVRGSGGVEEYIDIPDFKEEQQAPGQEQEE